MNKKRTIYILIEIIYALLNIAFAYRYKTHSFITTEYDINYIYAMVIIIVSIMITFIPPINKVIVFLFMFVYLMYLSGQTNYYVNNNTYYQFSLNNVLKYGSYTSLIIPLILMIVFIVLYFIFQKNTFKLKETIKYRLIGPALLSLCVTLGASTTKKTQYIKFDNNYTTQNTDYYTYLYPEENSSEFVNKFGIFAYAQRQIEKDKELSFKDNTVREIDEYLSTLTPTIKNDYSSIFEGKNVIFIQVEDFGYTFMNEVLTPRLFNEFNNSLKVHSFSTPYLMGHGSDSEFMANVSLVPDSHDTFACYLGDHNTYPTTLPKLFKEKGYATNFFINNYSSFYNREKMVPLYGYDEFYDNTRMGGTDIDMLDYTQTIANIHAYADYPIMSYWEIENNEIVDEETKNRIKEVIPDVNDNVIGYYANAIKLDSYIDLLLNTLEKENKLDDTVIVIFGDGGVKEYTNSELFFINNIKTDGITNRGSLLDLIPTIADLWNLDYDYKTVLGRSVFSPNYDGISYHIYTFGRGDNYYWTTDYAYYYFYGHGVYPRGEFDITYQEMLNRFEDMAKRIKISFDIIKYDYFNKK